MQEESKHKSIALIKIFSALIYLIVVVFVALTASYQGLSQYFTNSALFAKSDTEALKAIAFDNSNPEAYKTLAIILLQDNNYPEAIKNITSAIELRPNDYLLWLRLGYFRYKMNDLEGAKLAYEKATSLAPNYVQPERYIGRMLLKAEDFKQAFVHLSRAAAIDESYLPEVLHLARKTYPGDPSAIESAVQPRSIQAKKVMALYFIKHKILSDTARDFLLSDELERSEKDEVITRLIEIKDFETAFLVWRSKVKVNVDENNLLVNGDFETEIDPDENNFGWVINIEEKNIAFKVDTSNAYSNSVAIQIIFNGNSETGNPFFSQLVPVDPARQYHLSFTTRSEDIITGGLPVIAVVDANSGRIIEQSKPLPDKNKWSQFTMDFSTSLETDAIIVSVQRLKCNTSPCPIFGQLWLDDFQMTPQNR